MCSWVRLFAIRSSDKLNADFLTRIPEAQTNRNHRLIKTIRLYVSTIYPLKRHLPSITGPRSRSRAISAAITLQSSIRTAYPASRTTASDSTPFPTFQSLGPKPLPPVDATIGEKQVVQKIRCLTSSTRTIIAWVSWRCPDDAAR